MERPSIMGLHVVLPLHLTLLLHPPLFRHSPPPQPLPPPPPRPFRSGPCPPLPVHGSNLRDNFFRHPPFRRGRNPRDSLVLAPVQDSFPVAPLLPLGHPPFWSRLLLVLHLLPLPIPPPLPHIFHHPQPPPPPLLPALQLLHPHLHVLPLARILPILPSTGHNLHHIDILRGIRVPILDGDRVTERVLPVCCELPDVVVGMQFGLPCGCADAAFHERRVQWNLGVGVQFGSERCDSVPGLEFLCQEIRQEDGERQKRS
ncbi:hypothetical protein Ancab_003702 [Ancistrocladus abbreviatus]